MEDKVQTIRNLNILIEDPVEEPFFVPPGSLTSYGGSLLGSNEDFKVKGLFESENEASADECSQNLIPFEEYTPHMPLTTEKATNTDDYSPTENVLDYIRSTEVDLENYRQQNELLRTEIHQSSFDYLELLTDYKQAKGQVAALETEKNTYEEDLVALIRLTEDICGEKSNSLLRGGSPQHYTNYLNSKLEILRSRMIRLGNLNEKLSKENALLLSARQVKPAISRPSVPKYPREDPPPQSLHFSSASKERKRKPPSNHPSSYSEAISPSSKLLAELHSGLSSCTSSLTRLRKFQELKQKYQ